MMRRHSERIPAAGLVSGYERRNSFLHLEALQLAAESFNMRSENSA